MSTIGRDSARAEAQQAFVGLLATPLLAARVQPPLFADVLRHRAIIGDWVARLGYRLVLTGGVARLHRDPAGPARTAAPPPWNPPARRDLVLLALAAAACEDTDSSTTVQELSDEVPGAIRGHPHHRLRSRPESGAAGLRTRSRAPHRTRYPHPPHVR